MREALSVSYSVATTRGNVQPDRIIHPNDMGRLERPIGKLYRRIEIRPEKLYRDPDEGN